MPEPSLFNPKVYECDFCGESVTKVVKISIGNLSAYACDKCKEELFKNI